MTKQADDTYREADQASFASLVLAKFEAQRSADVAASLNAICESFTERFGPIIYSRFGKSIACGVALTDAEAAAGRNLAVLAELKDTGDRKDEDGRSAKVKPKRIPRWEKRWQRQERRWWLTQQRKPVRLHLVLPTPATAQVLMSLSRCGTQAIYARRFLQDEDLRQCLTLLYWPADALIARADADAGGPAPGEPAASNVLNASQPATTAPTSKTGTNDPETDQFADVVNKQLDTADQYYQHFTQRTIRMAYFRGIGYGMLAVVVLFLAFYLFRGFFRAPIALLWSIMAGALGALTSVLSSATFGRIVLDRTQGGIWNTFLGAFRPIIGALFGAAFFILINAGFLPVKIPSGNAVALYASIAFLAGFSHRWAQDTLKAAENKISAPAGTPGSSVQQETTVKPPQQET
jgi:hypothetical protein